jgi:hypothetical protein
MNYRVQEMYIEHTADFPFLFLVAKVLVRGHESSKILIHSEENDVI